MDELKKRAGIAKGISDDLVLRANEQLQQVPTQSKYRERPDLPFPFEPLETHMITKEVVDSWLQKNKENIQRVADKLGMEVTVEGPDLLDSWAAIRTRQLPGPGHISGFSNDKQLVVLIALSEWNNENGFFIRNVEMASGEDIILKGGERVSFPGSGGGRAVILFLELGLRAQH